MRFIATILLGVLCLFSIPATAAPYNNGMNWDKAYPNYRPSQNTQRRTAVQPRAQNYRVKRVVKVRRGNRIVRVARAAPRQSIHARLSPAIARDPVAQIVTGTIGGGSAIVNAMAGDLGKNLRGVYRGLAYCGLYMGTIVQRLGYKPPPGHGLARNWARFGAPASGPAPGVIMVTRGHVGVVKEVLPGGRVVLRGGNQGRSLVRDIVVSTRGVIAWRRPA